MRSDVDSDEGRLSTLMRVALGGDERAYAEFLRRAAHKVRSVIRRKMPSDSGVIAVEDIVQETLLAIHAKRHSWRPARPILPWLCTIARYKLIDAYRRRGRAIQLDIDDVAAILPQPDQPAEADAREVEAAMAVLTEGQRRVVTAIAIDGQSIAQAALALGMNEAAVRVAFHRGLNAISAHQQDAQ